MGCKSVCSIVVSIAVSVSVSVNESMVVMTMETRVSGCLCILGLREIGQEQKK